MELIYICSPYSHPEKKMMETRYKAVKAYTIQRFVECNRQSFIYSPIVYFHPMAVFGGLPRDADFYNEHNLFMLYHADSVEVLKLPGWEESYGIQKLELPYAHKIGLPVTYAQPDKDVLALAKVLR